MSRATSQPQYELLYHPQIPGRAEFIRLAFEATGTAYVDIANAEKDGYGKVQTICMSGGLESADGNPPTFSPPALRITTEGNNNNNNSKPLIISQTPNILLYLGEKLNLLPTNEADRYHAFQLVLTALDFNNEVHDTHHPIASHKYYEEQRQEALAKATVLRETRLPKFFSYFERSLMHNEDLGKGKYLIGSQLSVADLTLWQIIDGTYFAFPKELAVRRAEYPALLDVFYHAIKDVPRISQYLTSDRRLPYGQGVFRHYPELDRQS